MKKKNEEYYITLAEKLIKAGVINAEQLSAIISEVNVKYGFRSLSNSNSIYVTIKSVSEIFGDDLEIQKIETKGKDGRKVKTNFYNLKQINRDKIYNHFKVSPKRLFNCGSSLTSQDVEYRDAYLRLANKDMAKNPNLTREEAIRSAQKRVQRLTKEMINKVWEIIPYFEVGKSMNLPEKDVKYLQKYAIDTLLGYGVDLGIKIVSKKTISFKRSMPEVAKEIINLAGKVLKLILHMPVIEKKTEVILEGNEAYVVLVAGGLIMKNDGKFIESHNITSVLRNNHYHFIELSGYQIDGILKKVPHLFQKVGANKITMVGDKNETWKKIQEQYSPYNQEWIIPWCINSDIKLEDIQNMFPNSYQERDDIKTGSRIIIIKTDRSIRSFMSLAKLSEKFRDVDFPIGEPNLMDKLNREVSYLDSSLFNLLLGKVSPTEWRGNSDKLLLQIEEGYV